MKRSLITLFILLLGFACSVDHIQDKLLNKSSDERGSVFSENQINIMVPAYFDPSLNPEYWKRLSEQAAEMPGRIYAIANPDNGPGSLKNQSYVDAINNFKTNGGLVLGYVPTGYGTRAISDVESYIDCWYQWYDVDGIFLDEQAGQYQPGFEEYYSKIYTYIKKNNQSLVVGNPGGETRTTYIPITDVVFRYENSGEKFLSAENGNWVNYFNRSQFGAFIYNSGLWKDCIDAADRLNYGWIFVTNDILDNPWDSLPAYFEEMCDYLKSYRTVMTVNPVKADVENGHYRIKSRYNGKFLDFSALGSNLIVRDCVDSDATVWELTSGDDNHYVVSASDNIAELDDELYYSGLNIKTSPVSGNLTQRWQLEKTGSGYYKIVSRFSGMVMHQLGSGNVVQADYGGWTNQEWELIRIDFI